VVAEDGKSVGEAGIDGSTEQLDCDGKRVRNKREKDDCQLKWRLAKCEHRDEVELPCRLKLVEVPSIDHSLIFPHFRPY
jgi:hypothetical protein